MSGEGKNRKRAVQFHPGALVHQEGSLWDFVLGIWALWACLGDIETLALYEARRRHAWDTLTCSKVWQLMGGFEPWSGLANIQRQSSGENNLLRLLVFSPRSCTRLNLLLL